MSPDLLAGMPWETDTERHSMLQRNGAVAELAGRLATIAEPFIARVLCGFARAFTTTRVFGAGKLLDGAPSPRVYVANHTSHADFLLLWSALPPALRETTRPVAAADYWDKSPIRRFLARRVFRAVLVSRGQLDRQHHPISAMLRAVEEGDSLIVFPEGTRGDGTQLGEFRCGLYHLLQSAPHVEVLPVWLHNVSRVLPRGAVVPLPLPCGVAFGEPYRSQPAQEKCKVLEELRSRLIDLGDLCRQWMQT